MGTSKNFLMEQNILDGIWLVWRQLFQLNINSNKIKKLVLPYQNETPYYTEMLA